jgi:hypothetical protein
MPGMVTKLYVCSGILDGAVFHYVVETYFQLLSLHVFHDQKFFVIPCMQVTGFQNPGMIPPVLITPGDTQAPALHDG